MPDEKNCPVPLHFLDKKKVVSMGSYLYREKWKSGNPKPKYATNTWTGYTRFKILHAWRKQAKELFNKNLEGCYAQEPSNQPLNERYMSLEDRMTFREVKMKELQSFFDNSVWQFDNGKNVPADRVLTGKFILGWKKNPDRSPRAKARLAVQGFKDLMP